MGFKHFFHKIKMYFVRAKELRIPYIDKVKLYGDFGEEKFTELLCQELPSCKIKRNVIVSGKEGKAEIDCLVLYDDKLFAIEIKSWKGRIVEQEGEFLQEKTDCYTGEKHMKYLRSPFHQIERAIYLLKKSVPIKAWINAIVFFENNELTDISVDSNKVWFNDIRNLVNYIRSEGKSSFGKTAKDFFDECVPADCLYGNYSEQYLHCTINRDLFQIDTPQGVIVSENITSIRIIHHWWFDELWIKMSDGGKITCMQENAKIQVKCNGYDREYALCNLNYIEFGRTLNSEIDA